MRPRDTVRGRGHTPETVMMTGGGEDTGPGTGAEGNLEMTFINTRIHFDNSRRRYSSSSSSSSSSSDSDSHYSRKQRKYRKKTNDKSSQR